jgi:hypothetical protein
LQAVSTGNATAAIGTLDAPDRAAISPGLSNIVSSLKTLGLLDSSFDPSAISGLSVTFSDVATKTESLAALHPDLAAVVFTSGTATVHITPSELPVSALVKGFLAKVPPITKTVDLATRADDHPIVTIERAGQWYVSLGYTIAEIARRSAGAPLPSASGSVPAVGASSPTALVHALVAAGTDADIRGLVERTDPVEAAALHDYAPLFLSSVPAPHPTGVTVSHLGLVTSPVAGGVLVRVTSFTATAPGGLRATLTPAGCVTVTKGTSSHQFCQPSVSNLVAGLGVVAVQRGGKWYLDPYRTPLDDVANVLKGLNLGALAHLFSGGGLAGLMGGPAAPRGAVTHPGGPSPAPIGSMVIRMGTPKA